MEGVGKRLGIIVASIYILSSLTVFLAYCVSVGYGEMCASYIRVPLGGSLSNFSTTFS
jgi:hypothetical protein